MTDDTNHKEPVGYKRPPVATQFKPGCSGNPNGRPKSVRSLKTELLDELSEVTHFREGGTAIELPKARAIVKSLVNAAVGGNMRATIALLTFFAKCLSEAGEPQGQTIAPEDAEIVNEYTSRELRRRANEQNAKIDNSQTGSHEDRSEDNEE